MRFFAKILFPLALLLSLSACKQQQLSAISGSYEGDYTRTENGKTQIKRVTVNIEHITKDRNQINIAINDKETGAEITRLNVRKDHTFFIYRKRNFFLRGPLLLTDTELKLKLHGSCADEETYEEGKPSLVSICIRNDVISFNSENAAHSQKVSLYLNKLAEIKESQTPENLQQAVSLHELLEKVQTTNYDTRAAAQKLIRAKEDMKVAQGGLVTSFGVNGTINLIDYPFSAGTFFGNLVPFIFPTNWFAYNQKSRLADAEVMSYQQLIGDQMSLVEDIYYEILRDQHLVELLKSEEDSLERREDLMVKQTKAGFRSRVDTDLMALEILKTENLNEVTKLNAGLSTEYGILTVGLGFSPRDGVKSLADETVPDVTTLTPINPNDLMGEAKGSSVELHKALLLEDAANEDVKGAQYSYLNPADWIGWNAGIEHKVKIAKSNRTDVKELRQQTEKSIEEQVIKLCNDYNSYLTQAQNYQTAINQREKYINITQLMYRNGTATIFQLRDGIEGQIKLKSELETAASGLAEVQGKLNRLLWRGDYVQVKMMGIGNNPAKIAAPKAPATAPSIAASSTPEVQTY